MHNFFTNSYYFEGNTFEDFFNNNFSFAIDNLITFLNTTAPNLLRTIEHIKSDPSLIKISTKHAELLDNAVQFQFVAIYISSIQAENCITIETLKNKITLANKTIDEINARPKKIFLGFKTLTEENSIAFSQCEKNKKRDESELEKKQGQQDIIIKGCAEFLKYLDKFQKQDTQNLSDVVIDALNIITFSYQLFSTPILNKKIYSDHSSAHDNVLSFLDLILPICNPLGAAQASDIIIQKPQQCLRDNFTLSASKLGNQDRTMKKFSHQLTAYYLNLMLIAATVNDGRTYFLGLDRISWDAYIDSICTEIAEFFSNETYQEKIFVLSTLPFKINKEQAITFLRDELQYPALQPKIMSASPPRAASPISMRSGSPTRANPSSPPFLRISTLIPEMGMTQGTATPRASPVTVARPESRASEESFDLE